MRVGSEYNDPKDECYKYVCLNLRNSSLFTQFGWKRIFDGKTCCRYNSISIPIGKTIRGPPKIVTELNLAEGDFRCFEQIVLCQPAEYDQLNTNVIIHDLPNAKCCNYNGKVIEFGKSIIDAEVKNVLS